MYIFEAKIINEETDEVIVKISAYSEEGLEEEMGKSKWQDKVKIAEKENKKNY